MVNNFGKAQRSEDSAKKSCRVLLLLTIPNYGQQRAEKRSFTERLRMTENLGAAASVAHCSSN